MGFTPAWGENRAAIHKRVIRRFKWFAPSPQGASRDQLFINLEISLKIQRIAHGPFLLASQCSQELPAVRRCVRFRHGSWLGSRRWLEISRDYLHRMHARRD